MERLLYSVAMNTRIATIGIPLSFLLLMMLTIGGYRLFTLYKEHKEIPRYVEGPFSAQLLYLQGCSNGEPELGDTLQEQIDDCQHAARGGHAGYYVYDFNIRRSVRLAEADMTIWRQYNILSFPDSINGRVTNNAANQFNAIIPFENFTGFDYDCVLAADNINVSCKQASTSCEQTHESIRCSVFNPRTQQTDVHRIRRINGLDLLLPQGFITGPDLYKLLKSRFFPLLEIL